MDNDDWIKDRLEGQDAALSELRAELRRIHEKIDSEVKPLRKIVDMAIGGWTLLVLIIGIGAAMVKNAVAGHR